MKIIEMKIKFHTDTNHIPHTNRMFNNIPNVEKYTHTHTHCETYANSNNNSYSIAGRETIINKI